MRTSYSNQINQPFLAPRCLSDLWQGTLSLERFPADRPSFPHLLLRSLLWIELVKGAAEVLVLITSE